MKPQTLADVRIQYPSPTEYRLLQDALSVETKTTLMDMAEPFLSFIKTHRLLADINGETREPQVVSKMRQKANRLKKEWLDFMGVMGQTKNYAIILKDLSPKMRKLMKQVATDVFVSASDVNKILGEECVNEIASSYYYYADDINVSGPAKGWFRVTVAEYANEDGYDDLCRNYVYPYRNLNMAIIRAFYPHEGKAIDEIPEKEGLSIYSAESNVVANADTLKLLYDRKVIPTRAEKPRMAQVKDAAKVLAVKEFFPDSADRKLRQMAVPMVMRFYSICQLHSYRAKLRGAKIESITDLLSQTFHYAFTLNYDMLQMLLPSVKGFRRQEMEVYEYERSKDQYPDDGFKIILNELKYLPEGKWISVNELTYRIRIRVPDEHSPFFVINPLEYRNKARRNAQSDTDIVLNNAMEEVCMPLIKSALFLLAALGMADIAYSEAGDKAPSCYDGLQYVRPTALLRYVTGMTSTYEPAMKESTPVFSIDADHLLVRSLKADNPYLNLIADMAAPITGSTYKVDYTSFLKGCDKPADVDSKIALFRQCVSSEIPPLWEDFFAEARRRSDPFLPLDGDYRCHAVPLKYKELRHILQTDPEVRPYVIFTESELVLVKADREPKVAQALRKKGYII